MNISNPAEGRIGREPELAGLGGGQAGSSEPAHPSLFHLCPPTPPPRRIISTTTYPTKTVKKEACLAAHSFKAKGTTDLPLEYYRLNLTFKSDTGKHSQFFQCFFYFFQRFCS